MQNQTISFTAPNPYQADLAKIQEQRQLAQLLQQQSMQAPERFSYKGIEARTSPLTGLAKALQGFAAEKMRIDARNEEKALGERYRADQASDMQTLVEALKPREAQMAYPASEESFGVIPAGVAKEAKAVNVFEPSVFGQDVLKTPEMRNFAFQQYLAQQMPKQPKWEKADIPQPDGSVKHGYVDVNARNPMATFIAGGVKPAGVHFANVGNAIVPINQSTGQPLQNVSPLQINTSPESDRAFNRLSENQRRLLENDAARIGISAQELFFNTGLNVNVPGARSLITPAVAPAPVVPVTPAAPLPTSDRSSSLVQPPVSAAPTQTAAPMPATMAGMTPKTQQQVLADQFKAQYASLPEAANKQIVGARNLSQAVNEYQKALNNWSNYKMYDPNARAEMGRVYNNMMLQAKEAYNLGVLNGPDYDILTSIVADPTKPMSAFLTNQTLKNQAEGLKKTAQSIEKTSREVHDRFSQSQVRVPRYNPATQRIEP